MYVFSRQINIYIYFFPLTYCCILVTDQPWKHSGHEKFIVVGQQKSNERKQCVIHLTSLIYHILLLHVLNSLNRKHILISNHKFYKDAGPSTIIMPYILHVCRPSTIIMPYILHVCRPYDKKHNKCS